MFNTFFGVSMSRKTYMNMGNELIILLIFVKKKINIGEFCRSRKKLFKALFNFTSDYRDTHYKFWVCLMCGKIHPTSWRSTD